MRSKKENRYTCDDCKWNLFCDDVNRKKCGEFTLDRIMSDSYADRVMERNRRDFYEYWNDYLLEWEDE